MYNGFLFYANFSAIWDQSQLCSSIRSEMASICMQLPKFNHCRIDYFLVISKLRTTSQKHLRTCWAMIKLFQSKTMANLGTGFLICIIMKAIGGKWKRVRVFQISDCHSVHQSAYRSVDLSTSQSVRELVTQSVSDSVGIPSRPVKWNFWKNPRTHGIFQKCSFESLCAHGISEDAFLNSKFQRN